jgi:hypothetical protein
VQDLPEGDGVGGAMSVFVFVEHDVQDFDAWKPVFDGNQGLREKHGAIRHWIYRSATDPNNVFIATEFPTLEQARGFAHDPDLPDVMKSAGVVSEPHIAFREETEVIDY